MSLRRRQQPLTRCKMEMWPRLSTLVLLIAAVPALVVSGQKYVFLNDTQKKVEVAHGSSPTLCCCMLKEDIDRFRVSWYFTYSGSSFNDSHVISENIFPNPPKNSTNTTDKSSSDGGQDTALKHSLSNVTTKDSGWYFCEITTEIPFHREIRSNGTQVVITESIMENTTYPFLLMTPASENLSIWWMWILCGASPLILIIFLVVFVLLRSRCSRSRALEPIYANARPVANRSGLQQRNNLKTFPPSPYVSTPSPGRPPDGGKRDYRGPKE